MRALRLAVSVPVATALSAVLGCSQLAGIDEYGAGRAREGPLHNPCGAREVVTSDGTCAGAGVSACAEGFESDQEGGCRPILPAVDCLVGQRAPLGNRTCQRPLTCTSRNGFPDRPPQDPARIRYVDAAAPPGGDGSDEAQAFRTLKAGLEALPEGGYLLVKAGEYRESLVVTQSDLWIMGCAGETLLVGESAESDPADPCALPNGRGFPVALQRATLCLAPGTANVWLVGLDVTGPGDGIAIVGSLNAVLDQVGIRDTGHVGLRIEQAPNAERTDASAKLKEIIVEQATGVGIYVAGARVEITDSNVRNTRPRHGAEARGVSIHPGGFVGYGDDLSLVTQADVTIGSSVITGHSEAALVAAGARVSINDSLLGNLDRDPEPGRGLVAQRALPFTVATDVTVTGSVIQRNRDAGVDVLCARVTLEETTVRDTLHGLEPALPEAPPVETCSGQGVRIRRLPLDLCDPSAGVETSLKSSTVTGSRQAAVLNIASKVTLEGALLSHSTAETAIESCRRTLGNGLVLESLPENRAEAVVKSSLITNNAGAGIASGWGSLALASSILCENGRDIVVAGDRTASGARCGCGQSLPECEVERELFDSWLATGQASAFPDRTAAWEAELGDLLAGFAIWDLDHPEVPPVLSDDKGGFRLSYLNGLSRPAMWRAEYMPAAQHMRADRGQFHGITTRKPGADFTVPMDWNRAALWVSGIPNGACVTTDRGGLAIVNENWVGVEGPEVQCANRLGMAARANANPGWITVRLYDLPPGVTCDPNVASMGFAVEGDPNALRVKLERGMIVNAFFGCTSAAL